MPVLQFVRIACLRWHLPWQLIPTLTVEFSGYFTDFAKKKKLTHNLFLDPHESAGGTQVPEVSCCFELLAAVLPSTWEVHSGFAACTCLCALYKSCSVTAVFSAQHPGRCSGMDTAPWLTGYMPRTFGVAVLAADMLKASGTSWFNCSRETMEHLGFAHSLKQGSFPCFSLWWGAWCWIDDATTQRVC